MFLASIDIQKNISKKILTEFISEHISPSFAGCIFEMNGAHGIKTHNPGRPGEIKMITTSRSTSNFFPGFSESTAIQISETFLSIQGEGRYSGAPCFFIRLSGCSARCNWCDTLHALDPDSGITTTLAELQEKIPDWVEYVQITGGEPLEQKESLIELIHAIQKKGKTVLLETSGLEDLSGIPADVHICMDLKLPSSGIHGSNVEEGLTIKNLKYLKSTDEIKFVLMDREDFQVAYHLIKKYKLETKTSLLFSPVFGKMNPEELARLLMESKLKARMQVQLHKVIWGENIRGV